MATQTIEVGSIVEYGLVTGVIVEEDSKLFFQFVLCDNPKYIGAKDELALLSAEDMVVIGHVGTDSELLEVDNTDYDDVW